MNSDPLGLKVYSKAMELHAAHCAKYGVPPDWSGLSKAGGDYWMRKAKRTLSGRALASRKRTVAKAGFAVHVA